MNATHNITDGTGQSLAPRVVKDTVTAILHAIIFHRYFNNVKPQEQTALGITYIAVDSPEVHNQVEEKAQAFAAMFQGEGLREQVDLTLLFQEKRAKKAWFGKQDDASWEKWVISITPRAVQNEREYQHLKPGFEAQLLESLHTVIRITGEYKDHIPPITSQSTNPFPFQVCNI
ncbi:hypothetical protein IWQ60_011640 [Tieghemiomyces parasiticus]|uniref:Autophagy-related protein 101 n=1 Tax=Tieghemiomyces parasiticus TaxID=78921 RepID=A0A9W7ZMS9_9FUNG|nr:hypothetical protein IWQ60_011640 [Tieghemiomyces parasiticus]